MHIIIHGDCLEELKKLDDSSVDAVITDPPYGLSNTKPAQVADVLKAWVTGDTERVPAKRGGFMGKDWDSFVPPPAVWAECLRVLKPGGHMAVFAGARTQDLMGLSIRLAGFEIRDTLGWIYGSGFPKSMDISKAVDKSRNSNRERQLQFTEWMRSTGITAREINEATGTSMSSRYLTDKSQPAIATADLFDKLRPLLPEVPERIERLVAERTGIEWSDYVKREEVGMKRVNGTEGSAGGFANGLASQRGLAGGVREIDITTSHSDAAKRWEGWGTALKPAIEPIVLARKPLGGTVASNVLAYGVGGLNIDACRVGMSDADREAAKVPQPVQHNDGRAVYQMGTGEGRNGETFEPAPAGRFPANVLLDEHAAKELDRQSGMSTSRRAVMPIKGSNGTDGLYGEFSTSNKKEMGHSDTGGASRFFPVFKYQAKAPKKERPVIVREDGTKIQHPTVKPVALMEWLATLITPEGGTVLDPFAGTGTTLQAARDKGFHPIGIEADADYIQLINQRMEGGSTSTPSN